MKKHLSAHNAVVVVSFLLMFISGIIFKEHPVYMIPVFASLIVMSLQSRVSRWGYLIGAFNCVAYACVYWMFGAYGTAASQLLVSAPMQLVTFFNWSNRERKNQQLLKTMTAKQRVLWSIVLVAAGVLVQLILMAAGSTVAFLDNISTILSIAVSVLTMFAYAEYVYIWPLTSLVGVFLQIQIAEQDIRQIPYLIYSVYSLYCVIMALVKVKKTYLKNK